ncbi:hypothetical protein ABEB36_009871 [Hypothenemus hampei]|uniref:Uncharacterized protein n=1 Tax=Hypothenemus hampei TaxID=57062 RepID=A0ABD1EI02_HYPHA
MISSTVKINYRLLRHLEILSIGEILKICLQNATLSYAWPQSYFRYWLTSFTVYIILTVRYAARLLIYINDNVFKYGYRHLLNIEKTERKHRFFVFTAQTYSSRTENVEIENKKENPEQCQLENSSASENTSGSEYIPPTSNSETEEEEHISQTIPEGKYLDIQHHRNFNILSGTFFQQSSLDKEKHVPVLCSRHNPFFRHLQRNHKEEGAVKELMSMPLKDPKRKILLNAIRRQGNFTTNAAVDIVRPIRRPKGTYMSDVAPNSQDGKAKYIVCQSCLGYFSRNYLRRHRKIKSLIHCPTFCNLFWTTKDFYESLRLKHEVFPIMRNDEISKVAMSDPLICSYAESLLRKHKRPQIKNVISNKMRELGRLLISIKTISGSQMMFETMKPEMFDHFVSATKIISGYDNENRTFKSGSLALHMGTTLKQVCDIASKLLIKKSNLVNCDDNELRLKEIKRLRLLIENHWNSEISSLALKNLNETQYNKPKLMPLTGDVIKFHQYVMKEAEEAKNNLNDEKTRTKTEYKRLTECLLSLTLLLNRKRIGEIQYLTLQTYLHTPLQNIQEEFMQSLSEQEKKLTKSFKRVVTVGKGSKPVPILFSQYMQQLIKILLDIRDLYIPKENKYLFANPNTLDKYLSGYHSVKKLADRSGVTNPTMFTSTRLRKQIATILQVLNVTDNEFEQFANFMGHTKKLMQIIIDVYQTAKVSKLLLAINSGNAHKYDGKALADIELSDIQSDDDNDEPKTTTKKLTNTNLPKEKSWTETQKSDIRIYFKKQIKEKVAPRKQQVMEFLQKHPENFKNKNWVQVKSYVYNCYK